MTADVALATERRYEAPSASTPYIGNLLQEDRLVSAALARLGLSSVRVDWSRPDVDWSTFRCVVLRTPWDYFERFDEFSAWIDRVEVATTLFNAPSIVRWNMDKHYLVDLQEAGVHVVPMEILEAGTTCDLGRLLVARGWHEAVLKPAVSGGARHTYRIDRATASEHQSVLRRLLARESMIVQPFQSDILEHGEVTVVVIGGQPTHAVRKVARPGDFRVQDDHGGTVHDHTPAEEELSLAEQAMAAVQPSPLYGRVDMVRDNDGALSVMELELVEPELWYRIHPAAAEVFARGLAARL